MKGVASILYMALLTGVLLVVTATTPATADGDCGDENCECILDVAFPTCIGTGCYQECSCIGNKCTCGARCGGCPCYGASCYCSRRWCAPEYHCLCWLCREDEDPERYCEEPDILSNCCGCDNYPCCKASGKCSDHPDDCPGCCDNKCGVNQSCGEAPACSDCGGGICHTGNEGCFRCQCSQCPRCKEAYSTDCNYLNEGTCFCKAENHCSDELCDF